MEVVPVVPVKKGGGNTRLPPSRHWVFTLNNPLELDIAIWKNMENVGSKKWVCQLERGEAGTPHLQGYVDFGTKVRPLGLFTEKYHWEKCKDIAASIKYCSKAETRIDGPWFRGIEPPVSFTLPLLRPWQSDLMASLNLPAGDRTINWVVDFNGNAGKTALCKHICSTRNAIYICGKAADCKYAVSEWLQGKKPLDIVLFDFTRSLENYVSYEAIESVKNGIFFSSKYESRMDIFRSPHVVCFSNFEPDQSKLSADRWHFIRLGLEPAPLDI